jgi:hypothetical protein
MMMIALITNMRYFAMILGIMMALSFGCSVIAKPSKELVACNHILGVIESYKSGFEAFMACDLILISGKRKPVLISSNEYRAIAFSGIEKSEEFVSKMRLVKQFCCINEVVSGQFDQYIVSDTLVNYYAQLKSSDLVTHFFPDGENDLDLQPTEDVSAVVYVLLQRGAKIVRHTDFYEMVKYPE